jgi:Predicted deacylase
MFVSIMKKGVSIVMVQYSEFWKTNLNDIENTLDGVVLGKTGILGYSAGKRAIRMVEYGEKQDMERTANYSSACGAGDPSYYAKKGEGIKPVIFLIGAVHGGEMEGIASILNFISILETGEDLRGKKNIYITQNYNKFRIILVPCMNPDGRSRLPFDSFIGKSMDDNSYYHLGAWKDGSICRWPQCKTVHPIKDVQFLGTYYNDDGINLMHDNFFNPMAHETAVLLKLIESEAPDFTVLLHGGGNMPNHTLTTHYVPAFIKERIQQFEQGMDRRCKERGISYRPYSVNEPDGVTYPPPAFNLTSAIHHVCGGISLVYESNSGLGCTENGMEPYTPEEILEGHLTLFEEIMRFTVLT